MTEEVWLVVFREGSPPMCERIVEASCLDVARRQVTLGRVISMSVGFERGAGEEQFVWTWNKPWRVGAW